MSESSDADTATATLLEQHLVKAEDPCPMCGYSLHRLRGQVCPECGQSLVLRVALAEPRLGAFYTGLVGLAGGVGFAVLVFLWGMIEYLRQCGPQLWHLALLAGEAIVLTALLLTWIRLSARIRRLAAPARILLAAATWLASLAAMLVFGMSVSY